MTNLMRFKWLFFAISSLVILPGLFSLIKWKLNPSIDFTGGSLLEVTGWPDSNQIKDIFTKDQVEVFSIQRAGGGDFIFRTKAIDNATKDKLFADLTSKLGSQISISRFETVGPVIGQELTNKAMQSVGVASLAIIVYIAYAFREIPKPYSPWKFGVSAVVALLHDVLVVTGIFSILGHFFHVEIDALFVTALLTVIGFSVHDTIVVFDRIRENLRRTAGKVNFEEVVNESVLQTLARSMTTSLTVLFTLLALVLFGGESIRWFVIALLIGIFSGTYSSIFNAAPLLILWEQRRNPRK
ncbi:protein translocase subunit SecF [Patescibacteria group bacterium]|nr:protein translocase subunit SecF [Patescibacteria group bacterium]